MRVCVHILYICVYTSVYLWVSVFIFIHVYKLQLRGIEKENLLETVVGALKHINNKLSHRFSMRRMFLMTDCINILHQI